MAKKSPLLFSKYKWQKKEFKFDRKALANMIESTAEVMLENQ